MPLQSIEPRANVSPVTQAAGGYVSQYGAAELQSALAVQGCPWAAFAWHTPELLQKSSVPQGIWALHAPPVVGVAVH